MTTSDYLTQLQQDREDLVDNLETKGITGLTGDETFTELVPEVLNIPSGTPNWSTIGYSSTPQGVIDGYNYAKSIYDNWNASSQGTYAMFQNDRKLSIMPNVDTSNFITFEGMFEGCYALQSVPDFNFSSATMTRTMFKNCYGLISIGNYNTSKVTNMYRMFEGCQALTTVGSLNTSSATAVGSLFKNCTKLENVPILDLSKVVNNNDAIFYGCISLTDTSLNNILLSLISMTSYTGTKTFTTVTGLTSSQYPASKIQGLTNYQDFIEAGWTIGY